MFYCLIKENEEKEEEEGIRGRICGERKLNQLFKHFKFFTSQALKKLNNHSQEKGRGKIRKEIGEGARKKIKANIKLTFLK